MMCDEFAIVNERVVARIKHKCATGYVRFNQPPCTIDEIKSVYGSGTRDRIVVIC